jgi:ferric-dicitrate binding protein FerR (iron transport regulator)
MKTQPVELDCREASRWLSRLQDETLSAEDRERLQRHLSACDDCRNVEQQMQMLRRVMRRMAAGDDDRPAP